MKWYDRFILKLTVNKKDFMKTYAEKKGEKPFNWNEALNKKDIDWEELNDKAQDWTTCACGNQCAVLPRGLNGEPEDEILAELGDQQGFAGAIENKNAKLALHYLKLIEIHSAYLINEIKEEIELW